MSNLVVFMNLTLDGVMQAPGRPARRGPARRLPARRLGATLQRPGHGQGGRGGHGQYRCHAAWATDVRGLLRLLAQADQQPFTEVLNDTQKYVASTTLTEPLPWSNSTLLGGDAAEAVARLKQQPGKDLTVLGSGALIQSLRRRDLVDRYVLLIHPLVLGWGRRLFPDGGPSAALRLVDTTTTTTGVVIATYQPAEPTAGTST
jgi:dihydrofolate reductase